MARKKKPCEWCESEQIILVTEEYAKNADATLEIYPYNCFMGLNVQGRSDDGELTTEATLDIPMNYCPACGRKLGY